MSTVADGAAALDLGVVRTWLADHGAEVEGGAEQDLSEETKKVLVKIGPPKGKKRMVSLPYTSVAT